MISFDLIILLLAIPIIIFIRKIYNNQINIKSVKQRIAMYNSMGLSEIGFDSDIEYISYGYIKFFSPIHFESIAYNFNFLTKYKITITTNSVFYTENLEYNVPRFSILHFQLNKLFKRLSLIYLVPKSKRGDTYINDLYYARQITGTDRIIPQEPDPITPPENHEPENIDEKLVI